MFNFMETQNNEILTNSINLKMEKAYDADQFIEIRNKKF